MGNAKFISNFKVQLSPFCAHHPCGSRGEPLSVRRMRFLRERHDARRDARRRERENDAARYGLPRYAGGTKEGHGVVSASPPGPRAGRADGGRAGGKDNIKRACVYAKNRGGEKDARRPRSRLFRAVSGSSHSSPPASLLPLLSLALSHLSPSLVIKRFPFDQFTPSRPAPHDGLFGPVTS